MKTDNLFEQARASKPLLDIEQVNLLIASSKPVKKVNTKMVGRGVVVASVVVGIIYLYLSIYEEYPPIVKPDVSRQQGQTLNKSGKKNNVLQSTPSSENINKPIASTRAAKMQKNKESISAKPINIQSLKVLELNRTQLSKMGISTNGVIRVPHEISNDSLYTTIGYSSKGTFLDFSTEYLYKDYYRDRTIKEPVKVAMNIKDQEDGIPALMGKEKFGSNVVPGQLEKGSFIEPVLVTDDLGVHWRSYRYTDELSREDYDEIQLKSGRDKYSKVIRQREEAEGILLSRINTLIPILVRADRGDTSSFKGIGEHDWRPDVILWYEPSEALFSLLPQEIADEIRKEYAAIQRHESGPSCKHFESCQIITGKINTYTIYPNPCEEELNLTMDIKEDRSFTISLHDISGNEVKNCGEQVFQEKGEKQYHFSLNGLKSGMYMLLITSNQGEYIVQRIIKK